MPSGRRSATGCRCARSARVRPRAACTETDGVVLDLTGLDRLRAVDAASGTAVVGGRDQAEPAVAPAVGARPRRRQPRRAGPPDPGRRHRHRGARQRPALRRARLPGAGAGDGAGRRLGPVLLGGRPAGPVPGGPGGPGCLRRASPPSRWPAIPPGTSSWRSWSCPGRPSSTTSTTWSNATTTWSSAGVRRTTGAVHDRRTSPVGPPAAAPAGGSSGRGDHPATPPERPWPARTTPGGRAVRVLGRAWLVGAGRLLVGGLGGGLSLAGGWRTIGRSPGRGRVAGHALGLPGIRMLADRGYRVFGRRGRFDGLESEFAVPRACFPAVFDELAGRIAAEAVSGAAVRAAVRSRRGRLAGHGAGPRDGVRGARRPTGVSRRSRSWSCSSRSLARYDGRPHWGRMHGLRSEALRARYPRFDDARAVRDRVDPRRVFANLHLTQVLGRDRHPAGPARRHRGRLPRRRRPPLDVGDRAGGARGRRAGGRPGGGRRPGVAHRLADGYLDPFRRLTLLEGLGAGGEIASAGLASVHARFAVDRRGATCRSTSPSPRASRTRRPATAAGVAAHSHRDGRAGAGAGPAVGAVPRRVAGGGRTGTAARRLATGRDRRAVLRRGGPPGDAQPGWLDLRDLTVVVLGAGAEMGPLVSACCAGARTSSRWTCRARRLAAAARPRARIAGPALGAGVALAARRAHRTTRSPPRPAWTW